MDNIDTLKNITANKPKYLLSNANVFVSPNGYHYIDYLDPVENIAPEVDEAALTDEAVIYIEKSLQSNLKKVENQANIVKSYEQSIRKKRILDIGCGGGLFLSKLRKDGATTIGIELSDSRAHYAQEQNIIFKSLNDQLKTSIGKNKSQPLMLSHYGM